jgi:hypothetical protein
MSSLYLITYDLRKPGQYYTNLWAALNRLAAKRSCESVWIVRSTYNADAIRNHLQQYIDNNDRLLVSQMGSWASFNTMTNISQI